MGMLVWAMAVGVGVAQAWKVRGPGGVVTAREVDPAALFAPADPAWSDARFPTEPEALAAVAASARRYLRDMQEEDAAAAAGMFADLGIELDRVMATLDFVVRVEAEDRGKAHQRLQDPAFITEHFELWRWSPDVAGAKRRGVSVDAGHIRLTRYLVFQLPGRATPEPPYSYALYADPGEEARTRFTRPEIIGGAWAEGGAEPLVWLTERGVYEALMQGTVDVQLPDGTSRMFNVHQHNGIPYKPGVRDWSKQPRYWYFKEVDYIRGWGIGDERVRLEPASAVAGDIYNLGLGKLMVVETKGVVRLAVLGDTGGAFQPNLYQLDWLAGSFASRKALYAATADLPGRVRAGVLLLRTPQSTTPSIPDPLAPVEP